MTTELREGLAKLLSDYSPCGCLDCQDSCHEQADEILTYLRAHDGHAEFVKNICIWTEEHDGDTWATGCGNVFQFIDGGPEYNQFKHCCYCGHEIKPESLLAELAKENWNG